MSDNGPYTQPPQFPQDGEGNSGGQQPPYGGSYGQPGPEQGGPHPGQQYASGPYQQPPYGDPGTGGQPGYPQGYGTGPQHGAGTPQFQQPHEQQMFAGGQPPYGPGGAGGPVGGGYPPPKKSSAGLWIVIAGGGVIIVLVIAVLVMLLRPTGDDAQAGSPPEDTSSSPAEEKDSEKEAEEGEEGNEGPKGEPPYALPEDPCSSLPESKLEEYRLSDGSKSLSDYSSTCRWSVEGENDQFGTFSIAYATPYSGSDSIEGAKDDFQSAVDYATDEDNEITPTEVLEEEDINLGEEAKLVFTTQETIGTNYSVATLLIREGNINVEVYLSMSPGLSADENTPAPLEYSDVEGMMNDLGQQSLNMIGN
ncbi:MAG: DUF3558 domain-containing protein [Nocardiopsaceae bacterium]|nr:DUF3558 domain-containing protein [Nocardiopsaceae bacterium]